MSGAKLCFAFWGAFPLWALPIPVKGCSPLKPSKEIISLTFILMRNKLQERVNDTPTWVQRHAAATHIRRFLIFKVAESTGIRHYVTDIGNTRKVHDHSFKTQAETAVGRAAVTAQIQIPRIVRRVHTKLLDTVV